MKKGMTLAASLGALLLYAALQGLGLAPSVDNGASGVSEATTPAPSATMPDSKRLGAGADAVWLDTLPREARDVVRLIRAGGPFPYRKDGSTFFNREGLLPKKPRGHYREYTVETPGLDHRGARRIVAGGAARSPEVMYWTADHYRSFRRIRER